jgi:hypothetical protein
MEIKKFITSTNDIDTYYQFCGAVCENIRNKFGDDVEIVIGYVTERDVGDSRFDQISKFGTVVRFEPIEGIHLGNQAKVTRMYLASECGDEPVALLDIDMFVLDADYLKECFATCPDDKLGAIGENVYFGGADHGKFPMYYTHGKGDTFKKFVNPSELPYEELLKSWDHGKIDNKENIFKPFANFSDESLMRLLIWKARMKDQVHHTHRLDVKQVYRFTRRIDRGWWGYDEDKLENNHYIDCNPLRPFNDNAERMKELLDFLHIDFDKVAIR